MSAAQDEHGKPDEGMECLCTMDDITEEDGNYCEYQTYPSMKWHASLFCTSVVKQLVQTQFHNYMKSVQQPDCKAELRRLLKKGPPIYVEDKHALAVPDGDTHVSKLWFMNEPTVEHEAKLDGAVEGDERQALWDELKLLLVEDEENEIE